MSATAVIQFSCSGACGATAEYSQLVSRRFHGINGKDHGFGVWRWNLPDLSTLLPEDWVSDPLSCADYCPKCAAEVWPDQPKENG